MNKFMGDSWLIFVAPQAIRDCMAIGEPDLRLYGEDGGNGSK